ncbi:MAG: DUF1934 domain-containing protein [Lachnospiraceae bacterium]|nr:DUF1934 domain-containing protein [Lachnospiraceae bacterium]
MNRNVEVNVTGIHAREGEPTEKIEATVHGIYELLEDGRHIIEYDEDMDTGSGNDHDGMKVHNRVEIDAGGGKMALIRSGVTQSRLAFGENMEYDTEYVTPFGSMKMKVRTSNFDFNMGINEEEMKVVTEYVLEIDGNVISSSMVVLDIKNAEAG